MVWVRSEYAGELAVLSTWLCVLIPWNVTFATGVMDGDLLYVRFPFFQIRYTFGVRLAESIAVRDPLSALAFQNVSTLRAPYEIWVVGAAILAVAVLFSVLYYAREEVVESGPVDPVRLAGFLLGLAGLVFAAATYSL
ncbi:MAG: DUF7549 family protein, partial [Halobacteriota archaeon]